MAPVDLSAPERPPESCWWEWRGRRWCTDRTGVFSDALWPARWPPPWSLSPYRLEVPCQWAEAVEAEERATAMMLSAEASQAYARVRHGLFGRVIWEVGGLQGPEMVEVDARFISVLIAEAPRVTWSPLVRTLLVHEGDELIACVAPLAALLKPSK